MRSPLKLSLSLTAVAASVALVAAAPSAGTHRAGPPWISIEYPANPLDPSTRGAYLLVHAFHHQTPMESEVSGTAEGLVGSERKSIALRFEKTGRTGVYALRKQWGDDGVWSLLISVGQHDMDHAQALVERVKSGKGTVGALVMDEALYDDLQEMLRDLKHNPWKFFWKQ